MFREGYLKGYLLSLAIILSFKAVAQISVVSTGGTTSGSYPTLKIAFDAINFGIHQGVIFLQVTGSTTETATAVLNASGGTANYVSVVIYPTAIASITGNISGPLIHLNGADSVIIDGRINMTGTTRSLTFENLATAYVTGAATLRLSNGARKNRTSYMNIAARAVPCVFIDNPGGNSYNTFAFNEVGPIASGWFPGGFSFQSTGSGDSCIVIRSNIIRNCQVGINIGIGSYGDTIERNTIFFTTPLVNSSTTVFTSWFINLNGQAHVVRANTLGGDGSTLTGKSTFIGNFNVTGINYYGGFLQQPVYIDSNIVSNVDVSTLSGSGTFTGIAAQAGKVYIGTYASNLIGSLFDTANIKSSNATIGLAYAGTNLSSSSAEWFVCQNNLIGGLSSGITVQGIRVTLPDSAYINNNIVGGTVAGSLKTTGNGFTAEGIRITDKNSSKFKTNIICTQNIIRNLENNGVSITSGSTAGIACFKTSTLSSQFQTTVTNNVISSITSKAGVIYGISFQSTNDTFTSVRVRSNSVQNLNSMPGVTNLVMSGIYSSCRFKHFSIDSNIISNLTNASQSGTVLSVTGITINAPISNPNIGVSQVLANHINNLKSTSLASTKICGIRAISQENDGLHIAKNRISGLSLDSASGTVYGIALAGNGATSGTALGTYKVTNNMITLSSYRGDLFGISNDTAAGGIDLHFNSIAILGNPISSSISSSFIRNPTSYTTIQSKGNIFYNSRITGNNYAVMNGNILAGVGWTSSNYNNFYSAANSPFLWGNSTLTFASYKALTNLDSCSVSQNVDFLNVGVGDLHLLPTSLNTQLVGMGISGITTDFDNDPRNLIPTIGADELQLPNQPVTVTALGPTTICNGKSVMLQASQSNVNLQWYRNGIPINSANSDTLSVVLAGAYTVFGSQGCLGNLSNPIIVSVLPVKKDSINASICQKTSYTLAGKQYNTTGIYRDTLTAGNGCDSVITLKLTVKSVNDTVVLSGSTLTAASATGTYQWVTCPGYTVFTGAIGNSFTPSWSGSFALVITNSGCKDTSDCIFVAGLDVDDTKSKAIFSIQPNPSSGVYRCVSSANIQSFTVSDVTGRVIYHAKPLTMQHSFDISIEPSGVYFYSLTIDDKVVRGKLLLE
ncbi:MAG TPA: T9SS type A sorting domain-containing protein [Flavipsychrobacter sp.]|nr:T9SS type A sorting domain-containing protein [Flavipsychrobacter sp.]